MAYKVDDERCISCGACIEACPMGCIKLGDDGKAEIDDTVCISCATCNSVCPVGAPEEK